MIQVFFIGLLAVSILTGLTVEGIKAMTKGLSVKWNSNILSAVVSVVLSAASAIGYIVYTETVVTQQIVILAIALAFLSWLCAMVGYDKVTQAIGQIKTGGKNK